MLKLDFECWDLPVYSGFQCAPLKLDAVEINLFWAATIIFGCQITDQMQEKTQVTPQCLFLHLEKKQCLFPILEKKQGFKKHV
jgi:hypothetical protein